jgi:hypothetical protein
MVVPRFLRLGSRSERINARTRVGHTAATSVHTGQLIDISCCPGLPSSVLLDLHPLFFQLGML